MRCIRDEIDNVRREAERGMDWVAWGRYWRANNLFWDLYNRPWDLRTDLLIEVIDTCRNM